MKSYKNKNKTKNFFSSGIGKFLTIVILIVLAFPFFRIYLKSRQANKMNDGVGQELAELQARKEFLASEITRLKTEIGKEEEMKKKFNISKPGEELIIVTDQKEASTSNEKNSGSFWQKIKSWF